MASAAILGGARLVLGACAAVVLASTICQPSHAQHDQAVEQAVDSALRDYYSANGLLNRGMHELAVPEYQRFLQANPDHEKTSLARYGLAVCLFRMQKMDEAFAELEKIDTTDGFPFAVEISLMKGQVLMSRNEFSAAAKALETAAAAEHDLADDAAALRAESLYRMGSQNDARKAAESLIERWPDSPLRERVRLFEALALMNARSHAQAVAPLEDLLNRTPGGIHANRASLLLAQCLEQTGKSDEAAKRYQQLIDAGDAQTLPDALAGLATIQIQQGRTQPAVVLLDRLLTDFADHPQAAMAMLQRGRMRLEQKLFAPAVSDFDKLAKTDPARRDQAEFWIAKCELRSGKPEEAAARLRRTITEYPQSELLAEMCFDRAVALSRTGQRKIAAAALNDFRQRFPEHQLEADALYLQAVIEHRQEGFEESVRLCREFQGRFRNHELSASVEFLWAENDFLAERFVDAADRWQRFIEQNPKDERKASAQLGLGTALYRLEEFERAAAALAGVVDGESTIDAHRPALLMLGDVAFRAGDWNGAVQFFDDYLSFGDDQTSADDARLNRALALSRLGRDDDALAGLDDVIARAKSGPRAAQANIERGQIQLRHDDLDAARQSFERVVQIEAKSALAVHAMNHLGALAARQGRAADAATQFAAVAKSSDDAAVVSQAMFQQGQSLMAAGEVEEAVATLQQLITRWPDHAHANTARVQCAIALARLKRHAEALKAMEALEAKAVVAVDADLRAAMLYERAWCLREVDRIDDAVSMYEHLLAMEGEHALKQAATLELAEVHAAANRYDRAVTLLKRLAATDANAAASSNARERSLHLLATCQFQLGQFEQCAATAEKFISDHPQAARSVSAHLLAGEAQFKLGRHTKASEHFRVITEKYADDDSTSTCLLRLGECCAAASQWSESLQAFQAHRGRFADCELWFQAQFGIAWAMENLGELDTAMVAYRAVVEEHNGPTAARAQFQIGECLFAQKKHEEAVRELLKVDILYAYPEWSAAALYEAGRCLEELARPAEARTQFEQVKQRFADSKWAALACKRLASVSVTPASGG